ncbi:MAG: N-formylglutamate amidohydrolase [Rubrimonas sp.]|uniref:N-formylglutamate amidohydrolase n=1 Tax=Rubrimonas sp. TaxID=2036015 RepID=UPI002FDD6A53
MTPHIPGVLRVEGLDGWRAPLVFDSPHSGTEYPADFDHAADPVRLRWAEDTHVHDLWAGAAEAGAALLHAQFPRIYIDANRAEDDMDPDALDGPPPWPLAPTEKSRLGIGLCWTKVPPDGAPLYARRMTPQELRARVETYHRPYQRQLRALLDAAQGRWGAVWHVDCHSMQDRASAMSTQPRGAQRPDFVLGDRDGTSCAPDFTACVAEFLTARGHSVALNDPYKGMELVRMSGDPASARHSLQIEVNRKLYMDEETRAPNAGYPALKATFADLARHLAAFTQAALQGQTA